MIKLFSILWAINLFLLLCAFVYLQARIEILEKKNSIKVIIEKSKDFVLHETVPMNRVLEKLLEYFGLKVYYTPSRQVWTKEKLEIKKK